MAVVCRYIEILNGVLFFWSYGNVHSQDSFLSMFRPRFQETSSGVVFAGVFAATTTPEDVSYSWGWNVVGKESWEWRTPWLRKMRTPMDHSHLAQNCLMKENKLIIIIINSSGDRRVTYVGQQMSDARIYLRWKLHFSHFITIMF